MTYALMIWTIIACDAYSCKSDWREALAFENTSYAKEMCEDAGKTLFNGRKYQCIRTK